MFVHAFIFFKIPDVYIYLFLNLCCFKFLLSIFGLKNTLWDVAIEMSAKCYLIIVYVLPCCFEISIFLNFYLRDASVLNTQIVNSEVSS